MSANGPLGRELRFEGKLAAGPIDAGGKGTLRLASDQPATLDFDQFAGTIGGSKVQGQWALRFGDVPRIDGSIEAESLDAPAVIAAAIGVPAKRGAAGDRLVHRADCLERDRPQRPHRLQGAARGVRAVAGGAAV